MNVFEYLERYKATLEIDVVKMARVNYASYEDANPEKHPQTAWDVWKDQCDCSFRQDIESYLDYIHDKMYILSGAFNSTKYVADEVCNILRRRIYSMKLWDYIHRQKYYNIYNIKTNPEE